MQSQDWLSYLQDRIHRVEQSLESLSGFGNVQSKLREAMRYSLLQGGKRLRPVMVLAATESLNGTIEAAMPAACAVEMIHSYSLIHDDLPAMDNDDYRRGKLTNHKVYGEAIAVLAGDALLTHAFYTMSQAAYNESLRADQVVRIIEELSRYAGPEGMVGGQAADMEGEQGITSLDQLEAIHWHKTGDLIVCSVRAGGHAADATARQLKALERYGRKLGLAYQIHDDILDITGDDAKLGKSSGSDQKQSKVTYPYFLGLKRSQELVKELTQQARDAVTDGAIPRPQRLLELAGYLLNRDH